jgi:2-oxoglutarate dehydrogenase E1 component
MSRDRKPSPTLQPDPQPEQDPVSETIGGFGVNAAIVEEIRQRYDVDPTSVHESWAELFEAEPEPESAAPLEPPASPGVDDGAAEQARVLLLIHAFRARGHRIAHTDPLGGQPSYFPELDPAHYGFGREDFDRSYSVGDLAGEPIQTLRQILERLRATYCRQVGVEFTHVQDPGRKGWLQKRMEETANATSLDTEERLRILQKLSAAELFERFLHTKFIGQKRFSLEGSESLIPLLDAIVEDAPSFGVRELVIGMAHRGRLNVLSNILGKSLESIFSEFEDTPEIDSPFGSGDVKYHKGFSSDRRVATGQRIHLSLTANPSHLEAVNPVVEGRVRAKQMRVGDTRGASVVPILIHGDAAFAGQGMVAETLNLSNLAGYSSGGTIHVVINNQIGFTTTPAEARSTLYATDLAKMIQVPIFHVNGDDPEAVIHSVKLAMAYRHRFREDVVLDLVCYRRNGHNEGDEPSFTQPLLYEKIRSHESTRKLYTDELVGLGILQRADVERIEQDLSEQLHRALESIETRPPGPDESYEPHGPWSGYSRTCPEDEPETGVAIEQLAQLAERVAALPAGFQVHPKLEPMLERRRKVVAESGAIDWGMAETLAFATLLSQGHAVRLSGQDSVRGTFSHRHAALVDQATGEEYAPLAHLSSTQARFEAYDSLLSEAALLGFEYGYSLADPTALTIWEAQFGDFANGAQVIIDQFVTSAHVKWQRMSGLVMLLPHGYEGQGPEHSSARIERFLQACADDNLQVVNCTTAAQYFHVLRRQMRRNYRTPLIVLTPKSLLRLPAAAATPDELARGHFQRVIADAQPVAAAQAASRLVLCSGKLYYELLAERERNQPKGAPALALVRVEQLYPWPAEPIAEVLRAFRSSEAVVWAQEEPANMGAWTFVRDRIEQALLPRQRLLYAGRPASASTAVGSMRVHKQEQAAVIAEAFGRS